jgi:hypothetical protein
VTLRRLANERPTPVSCCWLAPAPAARTVGWSPLGLSARDEDPALIDLDSPAYLSCDDLTVYMRRRLLLTDVPAVLGRPGTPYRGRETLVGQVAAAVARAAYPTFLIGQLVSRALLLRAQPLSPGDPFWQHFPVTVTAAMDVYLAGVGDQSVASWPW